MPLRSFVTRSADHVDAFARRCWLAWRYMRAMHDPLRAAWHKAKRA